MSEGAADRRFADALARARADWAAADPAACAARAGCACGADGVLVPLFGRPHLVRHPEVDVTAGAASGGAPVHAAVAVLLVHYLLRADGAEPEGEWVAYRELPDGLFYAASFAARAEQPLARAFAGDAAAGGPGLDAFRRAAEGLGGDALTLADAAYRFDALPRVAVAVLVWAGDDEGPGQARVLFAGSARHYLPAEDLAGVGGLVAQRLTAAAPRS